MTALEEIKNPVEAEIERVVQSVNEWDDRTSPDDYPEHLLITSEELADILRNFAGAALESLQRENEALRKDRDHIAAEKAGIAKNAHSNVDYWKSQYEAAEAEVKRQADNLSWYRSGSFAHAVNENLADAGISINGDILHDCIRRAALASTGGEHNGN